MIKITDTFFMESDDLCVTLLMKKEVTKKGSDNLGNEYFSTIGYYPNFSDALKAMVDRDIQINGTSFQNMVEKLDELKEHIDKAIPKIKKEMK